MTVLTPGIGQGLLFTQGGAGTSPGYSALDDRRAANGDLQEGVLNASDFMVVQRAAGANMSVDIGMPAGGFAYVQGDAVSGQSLYTVPVHSATDNLAITAANPTNPRVDQVILEVFDNVHDVSGNNLAQTRVVAGTATAGATLTNRTGAAALPSSALLLADVLVAAAATTIPNTVIRDRRKWARGLNVIQRGTGAGNISIASPSTVDVLTFRVEMSGAPVTISSDAQITNTTVTTNAYVQTVFDGVNIGAFGYNVRTANDPALAGRPIFTAAPAAGSHVVVFRLGASAGGTAVMLNSGDTIPGMCVTERVSQSTANNTVSSG